MRWILFVPVKTSLSIHDAAIFKILISSSKFTSISDDHNQHNLDRVQGRNTPEADFIFPEFNPNMPSVVASKLNL
jgi:hypothetical protein